jgi:hypothetical protein
MALPDFDARGLLPEGIHDASLEEIKERFGRFQSNDQRQRLVKHLEQSLDELWKLETAIALIVDGSFVTSAEQPNDVDMVLVLSRDHDFMRRPRPFEYSILSRKKIRRRYPFDLFISRDGSDELQGYIEFFSQVRGMPDARKGLVRVQP